jgi:PST family polysaccharide transporter
VRRRPRRDRRKHARLEGLGAAATRGAVTTMSGQGLRILLQLVSIFLLARLLSPSDYGLIAMVTAVIGIGEVFRDFGLSSAAIQAKTLSKGQRDNLFWINTGIGLALTAIVFFASGAVTAIYGDDRVGPLTQLLALTFLLNGLSTQYRADLTRNLAFGKLALVDIAGMFAGVVVGVGMALLGFGYWALAGMQLAQGLVSLVLSAVYARWLPGGIHRDAEMRSFMRFGVGLVGAQLLGYAAKNIHSVIIGASLGATPLGFYNRAFQLLTFPLSQLQAPSSRVALPVLSRLQDEKDRYDAFLLRGQTIMIHIIGIVLAFSTAQAIPLFYLALGEQWLPAAPLFQILSVAGFATMVNYACYWVFLSKGLTGSHFWFNLYTRPLLIAIILVGSIWGLYGIAIAYSAGSLLMWPLTLLWLRRVSDAPTKSMFGNGIRTLVAYGLATAASFGATTFLPDDAYLLRCVLGLVAMLAGLALVALIWPRFRADLLVIADTRRFFRGRAA